MLSFLTCLVVTKARVSDHLGTTTDLSTKLFHNHGADHLRELQSGLGLGLWQKRSRFIRGKNETLQQESDDLHVQLESLRSEVAELKLEALRSEVAELKKGRAKKKMMPSTMKKISSSGKSSSSVDPKTRSQTDKEDDFEHKVSLVAGCVFLVLAFMLWTWVYATKKDTSNKTPMYSMVSPHSHRPQAVGFRWFLGAVVIVNIIVLLLESHPQIGEKYRVQLDVIEAVSSWIFLLEYCMRLYVIPQSKRYQHIEPRSRARLLWMCSLESIIDLLAFLPWFIEALADVLVPNRNVELPTMTWLRVLRLFRLFKVQFISESLDVFARVLYYNSEILIVSMILCAVLVLLLSILLFYLAPQDAASQEEDYSSVMACMYLAVMMLTGQGQPEGALPWYTKLVVCITCVFAVGLFAIQASMLTWGFENEADRRIKKQKQEKIDKAKAILAGDTDDRHDSSSSEDDVDSDWEEYEENIAGSDSSEDEDHQDGHGEDHECEELKKIRDTLPSKQYDCLTRMFKCLDDNKDGILNKVELEAIPGLNHEFIPKVDKNGTGSIEVQEFIHWILDVRKTQPPDIFKLFLTELVKACREGKKKRSGELEIDKQIMDLEKLAKGFKELKVENERLKLENYKLKKEHQRRAANEKSSKVNQGQPDPTSPPSTETSPRVPDN